jgi:hypothetical protein
MSTLTIPVTFTRLSYQPEETIISSCNHCFAWIGESEHEAVLEALEKLHCCVALPDASS